MTQLSGGFHATNLPQGSGRSGPAVVLDTNVLVAAGFNPQSASARIVDAVKRGDLRMVWNDATRSEIERVLRVIPPVRPSVPPPFLAENRLAAPTDPGRFQAVPDRDDREFAALAAAGKAALISNDGHLLASRDRLGVPVLRPAEFWQLRAPNPR